MPSRCATVADTFGIGVSGVQVATMTRSMSPRRPPLPSSVPPSQPRPGTAGAGPGLFGSSGQQPGQRLPHADRIPVLHQPFDDRAAPLRDDRAPVAAGLDVAELGAGAHPVPAG